MSKKKYIALYKEELATRKAVEEMYDGLFADMCEIRAVLHIIIVLDVNVYKLYKLGLHRYNAQYGSKGRFISKDVYDLIMKVCFNQVR